MTQETTEDINKQISEFHRTTDQAVCVVTSQNPDKMCRKHFEFYKDKDGKIQLRLTGISLTDKNDDKNETVDSVSTN